MLGFLRALISQLLQEDFICPPCLAQKVCTVLTDDLRSLTVALSRYAEVPRQQDEGEGSSTPALVLPNLSETVPR